MADCTLPVEAPIDLPAPHIAAGKNQVDKLSRLIQEEGEAAVDPKTKETILHAAARNGAIKSAKWIVDSKAVDCTAFAGNGYTAAHYAALNGHLGVLKILLTQDDRRLESKLVTQTTHTIENLSILSLAAIGGYTDVVEWLLNNFGNKADVPTSKGRHASHYAAAYGKLGVLTLLIKLLGEEEAHVKDEQDTTPVFLAAQQGYLEVLSYLVNDLGADAEAKDREGFNSVHAATQAGQTQCVMWLVAKLGPSYIVSPTTKDGATPLHMAAGSGNTDLLRYFLDTMDNANDVNVTDYSNYTPLHDACEEGFLPAVQLLLKHGAKTDIKNKDNQTAYTLAMESGHSDIGAVIRDNTLTRKSAKVSSSEKNKRGPRTSRQETEELSSAIQQQAEVLEQRKEKQLSTQSSQQDLDVEASPAKDTTMLINKKAEDDDEIEHTLGPHGDLYANPKKLRNKRKTGMQHNPDYDIEGFSSDPPSSVKNQRQASHTQPEFEGPYAVINDTESFISRDRRSRVRRHYGQDTDSDISAVTGRSGMRGHNVPHGWYPGAYDPVMFKRRGPRSVASSKHSSREGSQHSGYPPMMAPHPQMGYPYPYFAGMPYPGYWGHPQAAYGMPADGGVQPPMIPAGMPYGVYPHPRLQQQRSTAKQPKKKGKGSKHHKSDRSTHGSSLFSSSPKKHTDQDIGYGPSIDTPSALQEDIVHDHPHAPPISSPEGLMDDSSDVNKFSSNIIMLKKSDQVREVEGITLNPSKAEPEVYDGRYDDFIMTDDEDDFGVDPEMNVGLLAEAAAILAIGCVAGLKGLNRVRKKTSSSAVMDRHLPPERHGLSTAWDDTTYGFEMRKRRGSVDKNIKGLSPEEFANVEDVERATWDKEKPKAKKAKQASQKKEKESKKDKDKKKSAPAGEGADVQNELITPELHKESYQSVSKHLGQKILTDSLGAMHSSMLQIAPSSGLGSRMSLTQTSDEEGERDDDDDFGDTIFLLEDGETPSKRQRKVAGDETTSATEASRVNTDVEEEGKGKKKKKEKKSGTKDKKEKVKKKKEKKVKESSKTKSKNGAEEAKDKKQTSDETASAKPPAKEERQPLVKNMAEAKTVNAPASTPPVKEPQPKRLEMHVPPTPPPAEQSTVPAKKAEKWPRTAQGPHTPAPAVEKEPPAAPAKKVYPKEERPKMPQGPSFGQRLMAATPKDQPPAKVKVEEKARESKKPDAKPQITKPVEAPPPKKAAPPKAKEKIPTKPPAKVTAPPPPPPKKEVFASSREVVNDMSIFDKESSEDEEPVPAPVPKTFIDDDFTKDLFGEEGLAELNEALRQLEDIQVSLTTDIETPSNAKPAASKPARGGESKRKGQPEKPKISSAPAKKTSVSSTGHKENQLFSFDVDDLDFSDQDDIPSVSSSTKLTNGTSTGTQQHQLYQMNSVSQQAGGGIAVQSTGVQGEGSYTSPFERNVLSILQTLNENMQQMKNNPSVSQSEINEHERVQQEMIQNLISFSQRDPDVIQKILALLKDKQPSQGSDSSAAWEDLQQKLIAAQERQRMEASEHYKSQTHFQQEMQRRLEETAEMQMKGFQSNFDKYTRMMSQQMTEQMAEQMKKLDEEMRKREKEKEQESKKHRSKGKKKKHKKHRYSETSETGSSSEEEVVKSGLVQPSAKVVVASKPAIKTDTARIVRQDLLREEDDMRTSSMPKLLVEKKQQMLKRMETKISFDHSTDALKRFESTSEPPRDLDETLEESEEDEDEMQYQHARPVTIKRADIKKQQQNTGYTPHRPNSARQGVAEKRVIPIKGDERPDHSDLAGAGAELAALLKRKAV